MIFRATPLSGYAEPYGQLCAILQDGTREWRWEIPQDLGEEAMTWRARPGGHSMGATMLHIICAELYWFEIVGLGQEPSAEDKALLMWDAFDPDLADWPEAPFQPLSWYFDLHDRFRARTLEAVRRWPGPDVLRPGGGGEVDMPWVLGHVIQHESYHGGQIVLLHDLWRRR